jgi:hypothetical protein
MKSNRHAVRLKMCASSHCNMTVVFLNIDTLTPKALKSSYNVLNITNLRISKQLFSLSH